MKLVKSTRDYEEHLDNLLEIQNLKSKGMNDRDVCKALKISSSTLQTYKQTLTSLDTRSLTPDVIFNKRCELDDQIQAVISKLHNIADQVDSTYSTKHNELLETIKDENVDMNTRISLKRSLRYPVEDIIQVQKTLLEAVATRSRVWGVDKESGDQTQFQQNKKLVVNFSSQQKVSMDKNKLNTIADALIEKLNDGMQVSEEATGESDNIS